MCSSRSRIKSVSGVGYSSKRCKRHRRLVFGDSWLKTRGRMIVVVVVIAVAVVTRMPWKKHRTE